MILTSKKNWKVTGGVLLFVGMIACNHVPEYPKSFVSTDATEFAKFKEECSKRPSPPSRTSRQLGQTDVFISFCQPAVNGREIWGDLVKYDEMWRTGANEATVFSTTRDILINSDTVAAGVYALFTIPTPNDWTIILNKKYDTWGAYDYNVEEDILRFSVKTTATNTLQERMNFDISDNGLVTFSWEKLSFDFQLTPL